MRVDGTYTFEADRDRVWKRLLDPDLLATCIPGCQELNTIGEGQYELVLKVGLGAISGVYSGTVTLTDIVEPSSYKMVVTGKGAGGTIKGEGSLALRDEDGEAVVEVAGEAQVSGLIARVGQRLLGSASKSLMNQFFGCMREKVESN